MAFNHRKLMTDLGKINETICAIFCNPNENKDGYCPTSCIYRCYPICNRPFTSLIPAATSSDDHPNKPQKTHLSLIISLSLLATACILFSLYTIYKYYKNRQARSSRPTQEQELTDDDFIDEDHAPTLDHPIWYIRTVGLQPSVIEQITVLRYKRGEGLVEGTDCSVCLSDFQEDETLRLLPKCSHAFHLSCIDTWLRSHTNCPMCRASIVSASGSVPQPEEQGAGDSSVSEENDQVVGRESEDRNCELRVGISEESELLDENGGNSPETSEAQPMRRSVSLDCLSAAVIIADIGTSHSGKFGGNSNSQLGKLEIDLGIVAKKLDFNQSLLRLLGGASFGRSVQKGPVLMKRSFSCSGKVMLSRYNRSHRNSVLPS